MRYDKKKGNLVSDGLILVVFLFAFIIIGLVAYNGFSPVFSDLETQQQYSNGSRQLVADFSPKFAPMIDDLALILLALFWLGAIALSFLIDTHPVYFGIAIILFIAVLVATSALQGTLESTLSSGFASNESEFPKMFWIAEHLLFIIIGFGITVGGALYAKFAR